MKKMKLDLNMLAVESFATVRLPAPEPGTVKGYSGNIQPDGTCFGACATQDQYACATVPQSACPVNTCGQASCQYTCPNTCYGCGSLDHTGKLGCPTMAVSCSPFMCDSAELCTQPNIC